MVQLAVKSRVAGEDGYSVRYITGRVIRGTRGVLLSDGALVPSGGTTFNVPRGAVDVDEVIEVVGTGQHFQVSGVEPMPPFHVRDRIEADQVSGRFPLATVGAGVTMGGDSLTMGGNRVVA